MAHCMVLLIVFTENLHGFMCSSACSPAFVQKYITVNTLLSIDNDSPSKIVAVTLAGFNWMLPHEHKNWYGAPVEVWRLYQPCRFPDTYIPISNMLCRCAMSQKQ